MAATTPLMISIVWSQSVLSSPGLVRPLARLLFLHLLGIWHGRGIRLRAALAMETWPTRSRGFMSGVLQGSWGLGFLLSSACYWLLFDRFGWRGMLWIGILPAIAIIYIRFFVKEPEIWVENNRLQREENRVVKAPLAAIFRRGIIGNVLNACWFQQAPALPPGYRDQRAVCDPFYKKDLRPVDRADCDPDHAGELARVHCQFVLGDLFGLGSAGVEDDPAGSPDFDGDRSGLSVIPEYVVDRRRLRPDRLVRRWWMYGQIPAFLNRALPDRAPAPPRAP